MFMFIVYDFFVLKQTGTIPTTIGLLSGLNSLNLSRNQLSGQIPQQMINCSHLSVLGK